MIQDEEYIQAQEYLHGNCCDKIGARCSGVVTEYIAEYNSRFGIKHIYGNTLSEIKRQLNDEASPTLNKRIKCEKVERYGGFPTTFYYFEYDTHKDEWVRKR